MKNVLYFLAFLLLCSCSSDELILEEANKTAVSTTTVEQGKMGPITLNQNCTNPASINESSSPSATPYSVDISWNNFFLMLDCNSMDAEIQVFADGATNPNTNQPYIYPGVCYGWTLVNSSIAIDFFNTTNYTLTIPNYGTKCLWWRIVLRGKKCAGKSSSCQTVTPWYFVTT